MMPEFRLSKDLEESVRISELYHLGDRTTKTFFKKRNGTVVAGVAQWTGCQSVNQRVAGLIPSQGLGCRSGPQLGAHKRRPQIDVSLFLSSFPSLKIHR